MTVKLIVAFASEFGVEISPAEFDRDEWATPKKIISYIERKVDARRQTSPERRQRCS
jgi:acyl carrier protein